MLASSDTTIMFMYSAMKNMPKPDAAVLGHETGHEFALRFRKIEGDTVRFGKARDHIQEKCDRADREREQEPLWPSGRSRSRSG